MLDAVRKKIEDRLPQEKINHLRGVLVAWWNGVEGPLVLDEVVEEGGKVAPVQKKPQAKKTEYPEPSAEDLIRLRIMIAEALWGDGYVGPGDHEFIMELVTQFGLTKEHSVAIIGAGLAGPGRDITKDTGAWVSAFENHEEISDLAREQCAVAGLAKRCVITDFDQTTTELPESKFQAILSFDRFYAVEDKSKLLDNVAQGIAGDGGVLFTDYVVPTTPDQAKAETWFDSYWGTPHLTTAQEYIQALSAMGLDLRVKQDITSQYAELITAAMPKWKELINLTNDEVVDSIGRVAYARVLAQEAEMWANRLEALSKGELQVYRFLALKLG